MAWLQSQAGDQLKIDKVEKTKNLGIGWSTPIPGKKPLHCCAKVKKKPTLIQPASYSPSFRDTDNLLP